MEWQLMQASPENSWALPFQWRGEGGALVAGEGVGGFKDALHVLLDAGGTVHLHLGDLVHATHGPFRVRVVGHGDPQPGGQDDDDDEQRACPMWFHESPLSRVRFLGDRSLMGCGVATDVLRDVALTMPLVCSFEGHDFVVFFGSILRWFRVIFAHSQFMVSGF
ncbi:MAG: hypothetical protein ACLFTM_03140 [Ectothiorhodospira sp.]